MAEAGNPSGTEPDRLLGTRVFRSATPLTPHRCGRYSVVGQYSDTGPTEFVMHIALLKDDTVLTASKRVEVFHTVPPVVSGPRSAAEVLPEERACRADIVGDVWLDAEEREAIDDWLAEVEKEHRSGMGRFQQYVVVPHVHWVRAPETGRPVRRRFSCVGFVIEAYQAADIVLIDTDGELPGIDEELLRVAYPDLAQMQDRSEKAQNRFRAHLGLVGQGPWRVLLPGYVLHSLRRVTTESPRMPPYLPASAAEACFAG